MTKLITITLIILLANSTVYSNDQATKEENKALSERNRAIREDVRLNEERSRLNKEYDQLQLKLDKQLSRIREEESNLAQLSNEIDKEQLAANNITDDNKREAAQLKISAKISKYNQRNEALNILKRQYNADQEKKQSFFSRASKYFYIFSGGQ